jgi:hypothetical protein
VRRVKHTKNLRKCKLSFGLTASRHSAFSSRIRCVRSYVWSLFSSVEELLQDDAFAETVLGSQGNTEVWNVLLRHCVLVDEGKTWVNH